MSGIDEQFYRCGCNRSYGWFVRDQNGRLLGWLLSPKSPKREVKRVKGIGLIHLYSRKMDSIQSDGYRERISYFNCRVCGEILREERGINRLINFIKCNWDERTVKH